MQADTLKKEVCFNCAGSKQGASDCCNNKSVQIALHLKTSSILLNTNDNHVTAILLLLILNA